MAYNAPMRDLFNPDVKDLTPETPELDKVLMEAMRLHTLGLRVCMPGYVISVNGNQKVDVQPSLQQRYMNEADARDLPSIKSVPVCVLSGQNYSIKVPIKEGDQGMLIFCDRSMDAWLNSVSASTVDPADTRQHHLSDAIFVPGLVPFLRQTKDLTSDMVVSCGKGQMRLQQSGAVFLGADGGQEFVDLMDQLLTATQQLCDVLSSQAFTLTSFGPQPFIASTVAAIQQVKATTVAIQGNLVTIKSKPGVV